MTDDPTNKIPGDIEEGNAPRGDDRISTLITAIQSLSSDFKEVKVRLEVLEKTVNERSYETKPIWERALAEIVATRTELAATRAEFAAELAATRAEFAAELAATRAELAETKSELLTEMRDGFRRLGAKMDVLNNDLLTVRGDQRLLEKRIEDLESKAS